LVSIGYGGSEALYGLTVNMFERIDEFVITGTQNLFECIPFENMNEDNPEAVLSSDVSIYVYALH